MSRETTQRADATAMKTDIGALANDLARLDALLAKTELSEEEDVDVAELLKRLESAEGMAERVEAQVDDVLSKLDDIIQEMDKQENIEVGNGIHAKVDSDTQSKS